MEYWKLIVSGCWEIINIKFFIGPYDVSVFNMLAFSTVLGLFMKMIFGGTGGNKDG
jgi:hypothetical protein